MSEEHSDDDYDTVDKVERTDTGYRLSVKSKRGTGTNDRDEVKAEMRTEDRPSEKERFELLSDVTESMNYLRTNKFDEDGDE